MDSSLFLTSNPDFLFQILSCSFENFSPKLQDKIRNGKPGFEASMFPHTPFPCPSLAVCKNWRQERPGNETVLLLSCTIASSIFSCDYTVLYLAMSSLHQFLVFLLSVLTVHTLQLFTSSAT